MSTSAQAQDPVFSQFFAHPQLLNPAFTGMAPAPRINISYRNQWPALNAYQTYSVGVDHFFSDFNTGVGFYAMNDEQGQGLIKSTELKGLFSYQLRLNNDWRVKLGLEAGMGQKGFDWDSFIFLDQIPQLIQYLFIKHD